MSSRSVARVCELALCAILPIGCSGTDNPVATPGVGGSHSSGGSISAVAGSIDNPASGGSSTQQGGTGATAGAPAGGAGGSLGSNPSGGSGGGTAGAATTGMGGASLGGSPGSGGSAGGGKTDVKKSAGCGVSTSQAAGQYVQSMVMTGGASRPYSVRLPTGYDPARAYPVVVLLHGCGSGTNNVAMEKPAGADAILIRGTGSASGTCWETAANGADVAFFDAMVADTKARFCADEHRVFAVGYSSGSWLANQLTCIRADVLRGAGTVTGGESANGKCGGPVARIFIHDKDDTTNVISGSEKARDRQLTQNSCDKGGTPTAVDPSPCKLYPGCTAGYPVEWCQTSGQMHNRQDSLAGPAFWNFFKAL